MMTKKHIIDELKGAAAEARGDYQFNKDCIEEAIEFMFDTYVEDYDQALDDADIMESDAMDSISEEEWPAIVKKAKKDLKDKGSFENEAVEFLLQGGLDNNYDIIHEGGADSSIGEIILEELDDEDDEDEDDEE